MSDTAIALSNAAAARLNTLSAAEGRPVMLRVAVEGGGCSGFQYVFKLVDHAEADDLVVAQDGAQAVVDDLSVPFLNGAVIDFIDELASAEFRVRNPNAKSSCGCGVSFTV